MKHRYVADEVKKYAAVGVSDFVIEYRLPLAAKKIGARELYREGPDEKGRVHIIAECPCGVCQI